MPTCPPETAIFSLPMCTHVEWNWSVLWEKKRKNSLVCKNAVACCSLVWQLHAPGDELRYWVSANWLHPALIATS